VRLLEPEANRCCDEGYEAVHPANASIMA
jgi:hypothetical protein